MIPKSQPAWSRRSAKLRGFLKSETIYLYVLGDWCGLKSMLVKYYSKHPDLIRKFRLVQSQSECQSITVRTSLSEREWLMSFKPRLTSEKRYVFPKGWSHAIMDKLYASLDLPCAFSFKKGYVAKKGNVIKINGHCSECQNVVNVISSKLDREHRYFDVITRESRDSRIIGHCKKRHLSTTKKDEYDPLLIVDKPLKVRREIAKNVVKYGQIEGPLVYSTAVLRKRKTFSHFWKI